VCPVKGRALGLFGSVPEVRNQIKISILLTSFSKEELLDYDLTQDAIKTLLKSLLERL